jgi:hypothetical protein
MQLSGKGLEKERNQDGKDVAPDWSHVDRNLAIYFLLKQILFQEPNKLDHISKLGQY